MFYFLTWVVVTSLVYSCYNFSNIYFFLCELMLHLKIHVLIGEAIAIISLQDNRGVSSFGVSGDGKK